VLIASGPEPAVADSGCDLVAAPDGSDSAAGTEAAPLASAEQLLDELQSGETGCLRAGTYVARQFKVNTPAITLTSYPGERATLRGQLRFNASATGSIAQNMLLDGRNSDNLLGPLIYADGVILRGNEITNHNPAICVHVTDYSGRSPEGVVIENNEIHNCGQLPATNHQHGIYVGNARGTIIRGNVIYANADRGVQLYPDADDSVVSGNIIDGNGQGVIFGGGPSSSSDNNLVTRNVITNSTLRYNIESSWQGPTGTGNVARDNCVWTSRRDRYEGSPEGSGIQSLRGATADGNLVANPQYADPATGDYGLKPGSPCAELLDGGPVPPDPPVDPDPPVEPDPPVDDGGGKKVKSPCAPFKSTAPGRKLLVGTRSGDRLTGGTKSFKIRGKAGNDRIRAGKGGPDCLIGSAGRDRILAVNRKRDVVSCGPGRDRAVVDGKDRVRGCERVLTRRR
jgi:parallel beta-helix repeat protein